MTTTTTVQQPVVTSLSLKKSSTDKFFWAYTEEPHRSRRQAIIKAYPEVHFQSIPAPLFFGLQLTFLGPQTLWPRAPNQVPRPRRCRPANTMCLFPPRHAFLVTTVLPYSLYSRRNSEPKPLSRHP